MRRQSERRRRGRRLRSSVWDRFANGKPENDDFFGTRFEYDLSANRTSSSRPQQHIGSTLTVRRAQSYDMEATSSGSCKTEYLTTSSPSTAICGCGKRVRADRGRRGMGYKTIYFAGTPWSASLDLRSGGVEIDVAFGVQSTCLGRFVCLSCMHHALHPPIVPRRPDGLCLLLVTGGPILGTRLHPARCTPRHAPRMARRDRQDPLEGTIRHARPDYHDRCTPRSWSLLLARSMAEVMHAGGSVRPEGVPQLFSSLRVSRTL